MVSQRAGVSGLSVGTQKGDVYSFAIIVHQILYRSVAFDCSGDCELIAPKSKPVVL